MEDFEVSTFIEQQTQAVREVLGENKAIVAVSGGVDSTVSAVIAQKAIGANLVCVFIDNNFMRLGEAEQVKNLLTDGPLNLPLIILNERQRFMEALDGLSDAEEKRKAFRDTFYETLRDVSEEEGSKFLIQGTIKADIDETLEDIKTQHNILEQIGIDPLEKYGFQVVEPLKDLYKFQVREISRQIQLPPELAERQPFPGPGLSIRVVGQLTSEKLDELKKATFIVEEQLGSHNPSQFFAAIFNGETPKELKALRRDTAQLLDVSETNVSAGILTERTTGVVNGKRAYGSLLTIALLDDSEHTVDPNYDQLATIRDYVFDNYPEATRLILLIDKRDTPGYIVTIRAIKTRDFLTANIMRLPWTTLCEAASKILDSCPSVSRIYYDLTPKPPATIEYE